MVEAQYRLVSEGLKLDHLRLVMGTSMGGMHTWLWGERHPDFMDALMPLASPADADLGPQPRVATHHHRRHPRRSANGRAANYPHQPQSLQLAAEVLFFMSSNPVLRHKAMPDAGAERRGAGRGGRRGDADR